MKLLHITPQTPALDSGGGIGVAQTIFSLTENGYCVDYIGPEINDERFHSLYQSCYILTPNTNLILRIWDLLHGITNSRYRAWKSLDINMNQYDAIILDFTKMDYILEKTSTCKLIVKVHNVEYDYARKDYLRKRSFNKKIIAILSKRQECKIVERASKLLVLTEEDRTRILQLYPECDPKKMYLNPVCLNSTYIMKEKKKDILNMLITGSLWYGGNYEGICRFLKQVYVKLKIPVQLVIAGAKPTEELKALTKGMNGIQLIDSPKEMEPFFHACDVVIAPVFDGAGMKVKIAESLSYGKPVIGTSHAFIGYEITDGKNSFICNTAEEFCKTITYVAELPDEQWMEMQKNARDLFDKKYSIKMSAVDWKNVIEQKV